MIQVYTDGSCQKNPGKGGWGVFYKDNDEKEIELKGSEEYTTNNRMELTAVLKALEHMGDAQKYTIHTDSQYVFRGVKEWMQEWKKREWKTCKKKDVLNVDLWKEIDTRLHGNVDFCWVKSHNGNEGNEKADSIAKSAIQ